MHALALALRELHGHGHYLVLELASLRGRVGTLLRHEAKLVDVLLGEAVLLAQQLRAAKLREGLGAHAVVLEDLELLAVLLEHALGHRLAVPGLETVNDVGADGHGGHDLHAASDDAIMHAAHDGLRRRVDCLLRGAALAIDGGAGHALRDLLGGQDDVPPDVPGLGADLAHAAEDHVLDLAGVHPGALHERVADGGTQVRGVVAGELAVLLAARRPASVDDVGAEGLEIGHRSSSLARRATAHVCLP
mmetsp:Transcript_6196/g.19886  ORF Transcript_6196/g.19886 Transcript_6196/m.19886 type:complete len:248 (-) Transcript_6196:7-750(-)